MAPFFFWKNMFRTRMNYWSNGAFAEWLRKVLNAPEKPHSHTWEGWKEWRANFKTAQPFVYWFIEKFLNKVQNFFMYPADVIYEIRCYIQNRYIDKIHYLPTGFKPGQYADVRERLLFGVFETLVDFVEVEKAHLQSYDDKVKMEGHRSRELGVKYLEWEITLGDESPGQSECAKETLALYTWWKDVRPNRPSAYENVDNCLEIEQQYDDEDQAMMIRLCKIRLGLWT